MLNEWTPLVFIWLSEWSQIANKHRSSSYILQNVCAGLLLGLFLLQTYLRTNRKCRDQRFHIRNNFISCIE